MVVRYTRPVAADVLGDGPLLLEHGPSSTPAQDEVDEDVQPRDASPVGRRVGLFQVDGLEVRRQPGRGRRT